MAKGIGLIGNFRGKVGNMVGYNLKDSNNKQTQGVRVYQPVVKNPKTYAQATQRAKLAPINATYRSLKMVIDRGQEGKAYGNKSRLAWLSAAMKAFAGGWFEKSATITAPALIPLTKGSLNVNFPVVAADTKCVITLASAASEAPTTIGALTAALIANFPALQSGDQITFVDVAGAANGIIAAVDSIVLDSESTATLPATITATTSAITFSGNGGEMAAGAIIVSREGNSGEHLRSTTSLQKAAGYDADLLTNDAMEAAVRSYMAGGTNSDWAEESIQG